MCSYQESVVPEQCCLTKQLNEKCFIVISIKGYDALLLDLYLSYHKIIYVDVISVHAVVIYYVHLEVTPTSPLVHCRSPFD